jgi:hypothetical protein
MATEELEHAIRDGGAASGYVEFHTAGESAAGDFRCSGCGYGAVVHRVLPVCPMCGGAVWEQSERPPR